MKLVPILLTTSLLFYLGSFLWHLLIFLGAQDEKRDRLAFGLMRVGFLLATFSFVTQAINQDSFLPVLGFSQAMAFFAWSLAFVYLVFLSRIQTPSFGLVLTPILSFLTGVSLFTFSAASEIKVPSWPVEFNTYFNLHILCAFFAYASFTLSFSAGILYLIQHHELKNKSTGAFYHKLPSLEELEQLIYRPLFWGVPLLAVTIGIGFMGSKFAYGEYWIFDPKTIATMITAVLYITVLYLRYVSSLRGKQVAMLSLLAFCLVLVSFVGTRFIQGSHNYLR